MQAIANKNQAIEKALTIEEIFWKVDQERRLYELREKAVLDEMSQMAGAKAQGKLEGKLEGKLDVARNMLLRNMDIHSISEITGLSLSEIEILRNR